MEPESFPDHFGDSQHSGQLQANHTLQNTMDSTFDPHQDQHDSSSYLAPRHITMIPVQNPAQFPVARIQEVQADYCPSTKITNMWVHREEPSGHVVQVTADVNDGSVNHLLINDPRIISALGVRDGTQDMISLRLEDLRLHETFRIKILPGQDSQDLSAWIVGELMSARHVFIHWLRLRNSADPKIAPTVKEATVIAQTLDRRSLDVWQEIREVWDSEQGPGGRALRGMRVDRIGEDPTYEEGIEFKPIPSMWG